MDVKSFYAIMSEPEKKELREIILLEYKECLMLEARAIENLLSGAKVKKALVAEAVAPVQQGVSVTVGIILTENRLSKRLSGMLGKLNRDMDISELRNKNDFLAKRNVGVGTWVEFCEVLKKYNIESNGN